MQKKYPAMRHSIFPYIIISMLWILFSYLIFFLFNESTLLFFADEDGFYETCGALFFLLASILYFFLYFNGKSGNYFYVISTKRNVFFLLLGLLFFFGFAEELSWGQRIFNIQTPDSLNELNMQKEINIHNLEIFHSEYASGEQKKGLALLLNMDKLFSLFWFGFCILVPIISKSISRVSRWIEKVNIPLVPLSLGICFFINYLLSKIAEFYIEGDLQDYFIVEVKEGNFALLFFVLAVWFTVKLNRNTQRQH